MNNTYFSDIHNHIIFSIDDGAKDLDKSIQMVEQAADCNIGQIAATPHVTDLTDEIIVEHIKANFNHLKDEVAKRNIPVDLFLAAELIYNDRINYWLDKTWVTLNGNESYFLFELPLFDLPNRVSDFIFQTNLKGFRPILAHPERYVYLHKHLDRLIQWHNQGCLMQMNAGSLTGQFGNEVMSVAKKLLAVNLYSFAASDAHDTESRNFKVLPKAYEIAMDLTPSENVDNLFKLNPDKAIRGIPVSQTLIDEELIQKNWYDKLINSIKKFKLH